MNINNKVSILFAAAMAMAVNTSLAEISTEEAARLGKDLTPVGAEKAGSADGTIPAWNGGIKSTADAGVLGFKSGGHNPEPWSQKNRPCLSTQCHG